MRRVYWPLLMLFAMLVLLLTSIHWRNAPTEDAARFKAEYELLNQQQIEWQPEFNYREIIVDKNNPIVYATTSQIAEQSLSGKSFAVYMGANWCPWCRNAVPALLEAAKSVELDWLYYIDMTDERDVFESKNNQLVLVKEGTSGYRALLHQLDSFLPPYIVNTDDGQTLNTNEKRIMLPLIAICKSGEFIAAEAPVCELNNGQTEYDDLTSEQYQNLLQRLIDLLSKAVT